MKKDLDYKGKYINNFLLYLTLFVPALVLIASTWYLLVDGILYYCSDKVPFLDLLPPFVHCTNCGDYFIAPPILVYIAWLVTIVSLFMLPWILLKNAQDHKVSSMKILLFSISVPVLLFAVMFVYGISTSTSLPPSAPPNWDSPTAMYMIGKKHQNYVVHYEIDGNVGDYFVGISKIDLAPFIERKVIIKGNFPKNYSDLMDRSTDTQCIQGACHLIFNPKFWEEKNQITPVIDIDNVQVITEVKTRDRVIEYIVENGDTLEKIAEKFNISTATIKWANNLVDSVVKQGQTLKILQVTGVMHTVSNRETIYTIAKKYQTDAKKIIDFPYNTFNDDKYSLTGGQTIIVPDGIKP